MTKLLLCGLIWIALLLDVGFAQSQGADFWTQANQVYLTGDYPGAIQLYHMALGQGGAKGAIYFNLGNAYYHQGDLGPALLNYRRAQRLMPRDAELNTHIARIRAQRADIQGDETDLLKLGVNVTAGWLTVRELQSLVGLLWVSWVGLLTVWVLKDDWRRRLRKPLIVLGVGLLMGVILLGGRLLAQTSAPDGVVLANRIPVMSGPGIEYLEIFEVHAAAELAVLERRNRWVLFRLPDGQGGWIAEESVETI
jgi:tetratricopeptide (TPR) repeat protein